MDDDGLVHVVDSGHVHTDTEEQTLPFSLLRLGSEMVGLTWHTGFDNICRRLGGLEFGATIVFCNLPGDDSWFNGVYTIVDIVASKRQCRLYPTPFTMSDKKQKYLPLLQIQRGESLGVYRMNDLDFVHPITRINV